MIDTDKYEGHTPANLWGREIVAEGKGKIFLNTAWLSSIGNDVYSNEIDRKLMVDAPLLLAEVIRLREGIERLVNEGSPDRIWVHNTDLRELIE